MHFFARHNSLLQHLSQNAAEVPLQKQRIVTQRLDCIPSLPLRFIKRVRLVKLRKGRLLVQKTETKQNVKTGKWPHVSVRSTVWQTQAVQMLLVTFQESLCEVNWCRFYVVWLVFTFIIRSLTLCNSLTGEFQLQCSCAVQLSRPLHAQLVTDDTSRRVACTSEHFSNSIQSLTPLQLLEIS